MAPGVDYDAPHPYLRSACDIIDDDGYVSMPAGPGLGYDIEWDYINDNLVDPGVPRTLPPDAEHCGSAEMTRRG